MIYAGLSELSICVFDMFDVTARRMKSKRVTLQRTVILISASLRLNRARTRKSITAKYKVGRNYPLQVLGYFLF